MAWPKGKSRKDYDALVSKEPKGPTMPATRKATKYRILGRGAKYCPFCRLTAISLPNGQRFCAVCRALYKVERV